MSRPNNPSVDYDAYALHAQRLLLSYHDSLLKQLPSTPGPGGEAPVPQATFSAYTEPTVTARALSTPDTVGILGAGAGGLYAALILEDLGIPYQIIEAQGRVGGRLYTYTFPDDTGAPYNYFDIGAMRFPKISSMNRVFHLFDYPPLNTPELALAARLRPFHFRGARNNNTYFSYNGVTVKQNAAALPPDSDVFRAADVVRDANASAYVAAGVDALMNDVLAPFCDALLEDLRAGGTAGWEKLMAFDKYSTRAYMALAYAPSARLGLPDGPLPTDVINWCETFDTSTGSFDLGLAETVLDKIAFGYQSNPETDPPVRWYCIDGGSHKIADAMYRHIISKKPNAFTFRSRVTAIATDGDAKITVTTTGSQKSYTFGNVISTMPLPVLRTIDLRHAGLSARQQNALRDLNYGPSIKIGMQFRSAWWTTGTDRDGAPLNIVGGATYTDRPVRTVVYPSFGDVMAGRTTTLIASYCWTEDAIRFAALFERDMDYLVDVVLRDLADIHNVTEEFLRNELIDTKAWSWGADPYAMGAFAFFGPGKFSDLYTSMNSPAGNGRLHFAGEALSARHAWVEGALDSAWRAVYEMLFQPQYAAFRDAFAQNWGTNPEWVQKALPRSGRTRGAPLPVPNVDPFEGGSANLMFRHMALSAEAAEREKR